MRTFFNARIRNFHCLFNVSAVLTVLPKYRPANCLADISPQETTPTIE